MSIDSPFLLNLMKIMLIFQGLLPMLRENTKADLQSTWMPSDG